MTYYIISSIWLLYNPRLKQFQEIHYILKQIYIFMQVIIISTFKILFIFIDKIECYAFQDHIKKIL